MLFCMRTTLDLDDALLVAAKKRAAERRVTLTQVIEDALRAALETAAAPRRPLRWATVRGEWPPAVDVADRRALYETLEDGR